MAQCRRKRISHVRLCSPDLDKFVQVQCRQLLPLRPGQSNPVVDFVDVKGVWAGVETLRGTTRFNRVNVGASGLVRDATHLFNIRYDPDLVTLEREKHFIRFDSRLFKVLEVNRNNEDPYFLIIQCVERGDEAADAAEA